MKTFKVAYLGMKTVMSQDIKTLKDSYSYANHPNRDELPEAFIDDETDEEVEVIGFDEFTGIPITEGDAYSVDEDGCYSLKTEDDEEL